MKLVQVLIAAGVVSLLAAPVAEAKQPPQAERDLRCAPS